MSTTEKFTVDEEKARIALEKNYEEAEKILEDEDKLEKLFQRLEKKLKSIPKVGNALSQVPIMMSMIKSYVKKEYTEVPVGTIIAMISALLFIVNPFDLIPDAIPVFGVVDDVAVTALCLKLVSTDIEEYEKWRVLNGKKLDV